VVEARAAGTEAGLGGETFQAVSNGVPFALAGQFIEVRVTLKTTAKGITPVLSDIRVQGAAPTPTPASTATLAAAPTPMPTPAPTPAAAGPGAGSRIPVYLVAIALPIIVGYILARRARRRR
jgi:hypothetical protein